MAAIRKKGQIYCRTVDAHNTGHYSNFESNFETCVVYLAI